MFYYCKSLIYVNLNSLEEKTYINDQDVLFDNDLSHLVYCIDSSKAPTIARIINNISTNKDCNNICFSAKRKIIIEKKICIDDCSHDDTYKYEYNNICYQTKQQGSDENDENTENPQNTDYSTDSKTIELTENQLSQNTEINEKTEENEATDKMTNYETTNVVNDETTNLVNDETTNLANDETTNAVNNEKTNVVNDETTNIVNDETINVVNGETTNVVKVQTANIGNDETINAVNYETTNIANIANDETTNAVNDETTNIPTINEFTEKTKKFSSENFFKESQQQQKKKTKNALQKDEIIKNIKEDLMNGNLDTLLEDVVDGSKQDLIATDKDLIYQITTTGNQQNNIYTNISTVNLGECEQRLKGIYNINDSLSLIILKVDYYMPGLLIPVIGYEIYHPINKTQLDLNYCKDILVKLNIPVSINEDTIFKHDPNSDYYNDECFAYTTENGTDILISDRQNEYIKNNYSLCENNCSFNRYDTVTKKALCECETKPNIRLISNIVKDENVLSNGFNTTDDTKSNIAAMKCIDTLFSKEGLLTNIGSYVLLFSFIFFSISTFIFYKCGYHFIETEIKEIMKLKNDNTNLNNKFNIYSQKGRKSLKKIRVKKNNKKPANPIRKKSKNVVKEQEKEQHQFTSSKLKIKSIDIKLNLGSDKKKRKKNVIKKRDQMFKLKTQFKFVK